MGSKSANNGNRYDVQEEEIPVTGITLDDLSPAALAQSTLKPCDRVDWRVFGLSLAGLNAIASMLASLACVGALSALARKPSP